MRYNDSTKIMLNKADGSYRSALNDFHNGIYDRAVSSLYYSAFQTVTALMLSRELRSKSHTQVRSFVNKELVKPGLISNELGKMYNKLMDMRSDADYSDTIFFEKEQVENLLDEVMYFNQEIRKMIKNILE